MQLHRGIFFFGERDFSLLSQNIVFFAAVPLDIKLNICYT